MHLPPNVTAALQPMDQNPIRLVKLGYRSKLLCNIAAQENVLVENILKAHSICDAISLLNSAWEELPQSILIKAWNKIKKWDDDQYDSEDDLPLSKFIKANDVYDDTVREVQSLMLKVGNNLNISIDDIENWNKDEITEDMEHFEVCDSDNDDSITEEDIQQPKVSFSKAVESINTLIKWSKDNNDANQVADLISMRTKMVKNYYTKEKKQTTLDCFFKPPGTN
ncbi:jerky protein homolog-like [Teleopsis dalmanni]|uniref:jerky protein homolog-like n=1 Tax=Teleopsis dalmanni TaxID=139649 RepID=UPI0018CD3648|nr:jerky protein homolog-like [Teleopsis dalmanni]